jgi:hypothetical protein
VGPKPNVVHLIHLLCKIGVVHLVGPKKRFRRAAVLCCRSFFVKFLDETRTNPYFSVVPVHHCFQRRPSDGGWEHAAFRPSTTQLLSGRWKEKRLPRSSSTKHRPCKPEKRKKKKKSSLLTHTTRTHTHTHTHTHAHTHSHTGTHTHTHFGTCMIWFACVPSD